ncbi:calnexin homolog 1 [Physcomitrium patens]|nr:calnexin homolog 1-like [Physcomitrium patens]|eukprot:XP_024394288.1 calnexin homolog 1-like [Physcomitrella patens]
MPTPALPALALSLLLLLVARATLVAAAAPDDITFYENFESSWKGRWIVTKNQEYKGKWKHEKSQGHNDYGLLVSQKAKKYAIMYNLPKVVDPNEGTLTLQYDVRFQNGITCGGAYLKFLVPEENKRNEMNSETPYSIMFGADKCGSTNKVHFIFHHKNPVTREYIEHHMVNPALVEVDRFTHVYTATIYPNNTIMVFVDGVLAKRCNSMGSDFEPLLIPPAFIDDPNDEKPPTWDDRKKIPNPSASKPKDWNEDEPSQIVDTAAVKPEGWLEDEPEEIDDPTSKKPTTWDNQKDGEWEQEKMDNPRCKDVVGCGPWQPPMINNPAYKGKWSPPLIDNPNYYGIWKPKQIPNPSHFEATRPQFEKIGKIGIEIWTMDDGIIFDNILITNNETFAQQLRTQTWSEKIKVEKQSEPIEDSTLSWKNTLKSLLLIKVVIKRIEDIRLSKSGIFGTIFVLFVSVCGYVFGKRNSSKLTEKKLLHENKIRVKYDKRKNQALLNDVSQNPPKDEAHKLENFQEIETEEHKNLKLQEKQGKKSL